MKILDCTLRDGGYYNNWDFEPEIVQEYLKAVAEAKIDYVELGLRNFPKDTFLGAFAYTTEEYLNRLNLPKGPKYGVMIDAKTILSSGLEIQEAIAQLFVDEEKSKVSLVRVAAHFHEVEQCGDIVLELKNKGYLVGFNLMQAAGKPTEVVKDKVKVINNWNTDVLYFADSLGNMGRREVERITAAIQSEWNGEIGIHTHDNMSKGLDNSVTALNLGVEWLDSTITGMGRGAGNTQTENLLSEIAGDESQYNPKPIYALVIKYFERMQIKYGWGSNLLYFLGAKNDVHPTYIQTLLNDTHYGPDEIVGAIEYLSKLEGTSSYDNEVLKKAINFNNNKNTISGSSILKGKFEDREVLILGNGPSVSRYAEDIKAYILNNKPIVLSINVNSSISENEIDYYCLSHNSKFLSERPLYNQISKPIILPKHLFEIDELKLFKSTDNLIDYGIDLVSSCFDVQDTFCQLPFELTAAYSLAIAANGNAKSIKLVGFDGYDKFDNRQNEMIQVLELAKPWFAYEEIISLTPSSYPLKVGSIYAPVR